MRKNKMPNFQHPNTNVIDGDIAVLFRQLIESVDNNFVNVNNPDSAVLLNFYTDQYDSLGNSLSCIRSSGVVDPLGWDYTRERKSQRLKGAYFALQVWEPDWAYKVQTQVPQTAPPQRGFRKNKLLSIQGYLSQQPYHVALTSISKAGIFIEYDGIRLGFTSNHNYGHFYKSETTTDIYLSPSHSYYYYVNKNYNKSYIMNAEKKGFALNFLSDLITDIKKK